MRFVIVTGMSGAGKSTALKILEDQGYFCVDNLPIPLVEKFAELSCTQEREYNKVALGMDIRSGSEIKKIQSVLENLVVKGISYEILYLDEDVKVEETFLEEMAEEVSKFVYINNLILETDYYEE